MGISAVSTGKYKVYHILGKKIGCTKNIKKRVEQEQGYKPGEYEICLLYTSPSPRDLSTSRMPSSA